MDIPDQITSHRLTLIPCTLPVLEALIQGEALLTRLLDIELDADWSECPTRTFLPNLRQIRQYPEQAVWWNYLAILKTENKLIGTGGYQGKPDEKGMVEIGYRIATTFRNQGLAREMATALIDNAFQYEKVKYIQAHTDARSNPSTRVLKHCGFRQVAFTEALVFGQVWRWRLVRST